MQTVLVRASVLTKVYLANVVVLDVLSNPSDGSRTRRVVEVVELAVFAATVVVHVLTRYLTFQCVVVRASVWSCRFQGSRWRPWHSLVAPRWSSSSRDGIWQNDRGRARSMTSGRRRLDLLADELRRGTVAGGGARGAAAVGHEVLEEGSSRRSSGPRLRDWVDRGKEVVGPIGKSRERGWIWRDPDEDAEWVAARLVMDGTRGLDFRDWSRVGLFI